MVSTDDPRDFRRRLTRQREMFVEAAIDDRDREAIERFARRKDGNVTVSTLKSYSSVWTSLLTDGRNVPDVNVGGAQAIFANTADPVVQNNPDAFDFNDDGSVNVGDAQAIFTNDVAA